MENEELFELLRSDVPFGDIAQRAGITTSGLTQWVKSVTGGKTPTQIREEIGGVGQRVSPQLADAVADYYKSHANYTMQKVASEFGISAKLASRILKTRGFTVAVIPLYAIDPRDWGEVKRKYLAGMSCPRIAKEFGVSERAIRGILDRLDVPRRVRGRPRQPGAR